MRERVRFHLGDVVQLKDPFPGFAIVVACLKNWGHDPNSKSLIPIRQGYTYILWGDEVFLNQKLPILTRGVDKWRGNAMAYDKQLSFVRKLTIDEMLCINNHHLRLHIKQILLHKANKHGCMGLDSSRQ